MAAGCLCRTGNHTGINLPATGWPATVLARCIKVRFHDFSPCLPVQKFVGGRKYFTGIMSHCAGPEMILRSIFRPRVSQVKSLLHESRYDVIIFAHSHQFKIWLRWYVGRPLKNTQSWNTILKLNIVLRTHYVNLQNSFGLSLDLGQVSACRSSVWVNCTQNPAKPVSCLTSFSFSVHGQDSVWASWKIP